MSSHSISLALCVCVALSLSLSPETHAVLRPLVELETGEYAVTVLVNDSGTPSLGAYAQVNVTVCPCGKDGECKAEAAAIFGTRVGVSFIALLVIMASIALLLCKLYLM